MIALLLFLSNMAFAQTELICEMQCKPKPISTPQPTPTPAPIATPTPVQRPGGNVQLSGRRIMVNGVEHVARGPEITIASGSSASDIDTIAATGANAVRLLLTTDSANGMTPQSFDAVLARVAHHKMIAWVSLYTWNNGANYLIGSNLGGGNFYNLTAPAGMPACSKAAPATCYLALWSRPWLKALVDKYRANVIIDAAQEYIGTGEGDVQRRAWRDSAIASVKFFRSQGYTQPLEIMSSTQGRDLYAIVQYGTAIRATDTIRVNGEPQVMFGWQAYWADDWYKRDMGSLLLGSGQRITAVQAINQFVAKSTFPIQAGFDNYPADAGAEYKDMIRQATLDKVSWLWWDYRNGRIDCPMSGDTCRADVLSAFRGTTLAP